MARIHPIIRQFYYKSIARRIGSPREPVRVRPDEQERSRLSQLRQDRHSQQQQRELRREQPLQGLLLAPLQQLSV